MELGFQRQISHTNYNNYRRQRRDTPNHRQGQNNTARERQIYLDQDRQQSHSYLQPTHTTEQLISTCLYRMPTV